MKRVHLWKNNTQITKKTLKTTVLRNLDTTI